MLGQARPLRILWTLMAAALGMSCMREALPARPVQSAVQVDFIAVGHGDSILVRSAAGKSVLIDGGEAEAADAILAVLRSRGVCPLDMILLTHPHSDHAGGLAKIIDACGAHLFMDSGHPHSSLVYARLLERIEKRGVPLRRAEPGRQIDLGLNATLTLLGPPQPPIENASDGANANSVVARLVLGKTSVLFAGDADASEEGWLLSRGSGLRSTVLKVGHHGSRTSSTAAFLLAVSPRLAVISNWPDAPKHPHPETLARLQQARVQIVETGREGTIHLELDGETVVFRTEKHPAEVRLP
jgi:beta-lactamase superfamily II metal-dependent hydrolase